MSGNEKCKDQNDRHEVQSTEEISASNHDLTPGQQSLKRLKEMPYSKPDGQAFIMGWRKANSSTVKTSNMKNTFLAAIMVALSFMATAQTFESPVVYKNLNAAEPNKWFFINKDTSIVMIYGENSLIDQVASEWFEKHALDISTPDEVKKTRKLDAKIWYAYNEDGNKLRIGLYAGKESKSLVVGIMEKD